MKNFLDDLAELTIEIGLPLVVYAAGLAGATAVIVATSIATARLMGVDVE